MSPKLERLLNLTALLLDTERPLLIDDIARLMDGYPADPASFRRTFERDKDDLREMGIPLDIVQVDPADQTKLGYRIPPERYYLPDPGLEPDELAALKLAMGAIRVDGVAATDTLRKLGATADESGADELASVPAPPALGELHGAIAQHRLVEFAYRGETRTVEPLRLDYQRGRWYLVGFDRVRDARRSFRVDRIDGAVTASAPDSFVPRTDLVDGPAMQFDPWRYGDDPPVVARVRIDAGQAPLSRELVGTDATWRDLPDGSAEVEMTVSNRPAFRSFVLGFLGHAVVLDPPELRADVVEWLEGCLR